MFEDIPKFTDLSPSDVFNLDENIAAENFFGKTLEEARRMFAENPSYYLNDFAHLGPKGFLFYLPCVQLFVEENSEKCDEIFNRRLFEILNARLKEKSCVEKEIGDLIRHIFGLNPPHLGDN